MSNHHLSRRRFLTGALAFGGLNLLPSGLYAQAGRRRSPNDKIQIAIIGVGGRGAAAVGGCSSEALVAFCDVDGKRSKKAYADHPDVPTFQDYREMFDKMGDKIDAVAVMGPDHVHHAHALEAVQRGKHVYVEKPLCQTIQQTRELHAAAKKAKVKTQMGNQGHSMPGIRAYKEWVEAGLVGDVKEIIAWTDRPAGWWPQGEASLPKAEPIPDELNWELWRNGVDAEFSRKYVPFNWRGWTMWGTGSLGDMACHILDPVFYALDLGMPDWIQCNAEKAEWFTFPEKSEVVFHFPAAAGKPERKLIWRDGKNNLPARPERLEEGAEMGNSSGGTVAFGAKEHIMTDSHASKIAAIPDQRHQNLLAEAPAPSIRRVNAGHFGDWHQAIRGEIDQASSYFDYSAQLNELVLLGTIAQRLPGEKLLWDAKAGKFTNSALANKMVNAAVI